jgi:hypothetical protein
MEFGSIRDAARLSGNLPHGTDFLFSNGVFSGRLRDACDHAGNCGLPIGSALHFLLLFYTFFATIYSPNLFSLTILHDIIISILA